MLRTLLLFDLYTCLIYHIRHEIHRTDIIQKILMYVRELKIWMDKILLHDLLESHFVKYLCSTEFHLQIPGTLEDIQVPQSLIIQETKESLKFKTNKQTNRSVCNGLRGILSTFKDVGVVYH